MLSNVKYVITLDTDTQLPRDSAWQFVGAMAHPLNRPRYDEDRQRIDEGYGILQPRVAVSLPGMKRSRYARLCGSEPGIDPYTRVVSDVYQDLFGEGSFIGKGIYDVDAFERALKGRFPENRILSHDLLEGCYARSGLLSDVLLYEEYPSRYSADVSRRHRWIRGDWQIARWLLPGVPDLEGNRRKNPLSGVSRWKIFDNLRRSLVPAALTLLLLLGWAVLSPPWLWTLAVDRNHPDPPRDGLISGSVSETGRCAAGSASCGHGALGRPSTPLKRPLRSPVSPMRPSSVWMRLCARSGECGSPTNDFWSGTCRATRIAKAARTSPPPGGQCGLPPPWPLRREFIWPFRGRPRSAWLGPSWASGLPLLPSPGGSAGRSLAGEQG